ncbi:MAG: hypothetical protein ATN36_06525 [Epulopiscium sp. Nele67-Bin005]|nr:MAG: hypothetical protein ATN36_06525 [Epulopiscium sp. Nele67-Bin005]
MEKLLEITYLFDFYQVLLTNKQREIVTGYHFDDLSLAELASLQGISRQGVFDTLKKTEQKLLDYEQRLKLWSKFQAQEDILAKLNKALDDGENLDNIKQLVNELRNEM